MTTKSEKIKKIKKALEAGKYKMPNSKVLADCMIFYAFCAKKIITKGEKRYEFT